MNVTQCVLAKVNMPRHGGANTSRLRSMLEHTEHRKHNLLRTHILARKETRNLQRAHFSLTHTTPLLPATTLSEGECRVSRGESKVSRRVGLPRISCAPR